MYLVRCNKNGIDNNKYWYDLSYNKGATDNLKLPNCTTFCIGRSEEALNMEEAIRLFPARSAGAFPNAKEWFDATEYPTGYAAKEGSIAVFDGNYGHVAFVEEKRGNKWLISDSRANSNKSLRNDQYYRSIEVELEIGKSTLSGVGKLIGFIYLNIDDKRVDRNTSRSQISINAGLVNVRKEPNGQLVKQGNYAPIGIYNVLEFKKDGAYEWAKIDDHAWIAIGDWCSVYKVADTQVEELKKINSILKSKLERIEKIINE